MQRPEARQHVRRSQIAAAVVLAMAGLVPLLPLGALGHDAEAPAAPTPPVAPRASAGAERPAGPAAEQYASNLVFLLPAAKPPEPTKDVPPTPTNDPGPPQPPIPPPPPPIRYIGGIFNPDYTRAIVVLNGATQKLLAEGAALENNATLHKIRPTELIIRDAAGNESSVALSRREGAAPGVAAGPPTVPGPTPPGPAAGGPGGVDKQAMADAEAARLRMAQKAAARNNAGGRPGMRGAADDAVPVIEDKPANVPGRPVPPGGGGKQRGGANGVSGGGAQPKSAQAQGPQVPQPVAAAPVTAAAPATSTGPVVPDAAFAIRGRGRVAPAAPVVPAAPGAGGGGGSAAP